MNGSILVTCSQGTVGAKVVERFATSGVPVKAGVHASTPPSKSSPLVQHVHFDFAQRATVQRALADVDTVLLITPVCPKAPSTPRK